MNQVARLIASNWQENKKNGNGVIWMVKLLIGILTNELDMYEGTSYKCNYFEFRDRVVEADRNCPTLKIHDEIILNICVETNSTEYEAFPMDIIKISRIYITGK